MNKKNIIYLNELITNLQLKNNLIEELIRFINEEKLNTVGKLEYEIRENKKCIEIFENMLKE